MWSGKRWAIAVVNMQHVGRVADKTLVLDHYSFDFDKFVPWMRRRRSVWHVVQGLALAVPHLSYSGVLAGCQIWPQRLFEGLPGQSRNALSD